MAKQKEVDKTKTEFEVKKRSPFKDSHLLEKEIVAYINKFKSTVHTQAKRMSDYFEMSCFNYIVMYYERNGYKVSIENLQAKKKYRYKCSTSGIQSNYSFFKVSKTVGKINYAFEIQHNLAVQSSQDEELFTNPDIVVIKLNSCKYSTDYYNTKKTFSYVSNKDLISFYEVKHFNPYPELIFNFMGVVNELRKDIINGKPKNHLPVHLAPSLMISGKPNKQTTRIRLSLQRRYFINIIYDMFYSGASTFAKINLNQLKQTGARFKYN